jgi:hypothetical protein
MRDLRRRRVFGGAVAAEVARVFEADADGLFYEGDPQWCPNCGRLCEIVVDDDSASMNTSEDHILDVGQPRCDGSACEACASFLAERVRPCVLDCARVSDDDRRRAKVQLIALAGGAR